MIEQHFIIQRDLIAQELPHPTDLLLHGREIADPYRWLEDPDAPEALEPLLTRRLRALQSRGVVLIVDDADALDPWTARVVSACRTTGPVLRALPLSLDAPAARLNGAGEVV